MHDEVEWSRLKAHEIRAVAERNAVAIIPVAAIEQHGPHLPVMTDTRIGHEIAVRAARLAYAQRPTLVTPVVWHGLSEHHMPFGGTLTLTHGTFRMVLRDLIVSLQRHGFEHILLSNAHGGNIIALQSLCDELAPTLSATVVVTTYASEAADAISKILEDQDGIQHAGEGETAIMMQLEPDLVDAKDLSDIGIRVEDKFSLTGNASYRWRPIAHQSSNGLIGLPAKASADKGEALLDVCAQAIADLITDPKTWDAPNDKRGDEIGGVPFRDR